MHQPSPQLPVPSPQLLAGKVAVVTGAGGEIGRAIALGFLKTGARVAWVGRHEQQLQRLVREPPEVLNHSLVIRADVRREDDIRRMVRTVLRHYGQVDILVNNAGVRGPTGPVTKLSRKAWEQVLETNLTGPFLCARECLRHMSRRRQGRIINISSVAGRIAYPLRASYAVSKWGLVGLTLTLAQEAGASNVQVNAVSPGPVEGPALEGVIAARSLALGISVEKMRQQFLRPVALGRTVTTDDVSRLVLFVCSEAARNITGQILEVSAGYGLWPGQGETSQKSNVKS